MCLERILDHRLGVHQITCAHRPRPCDWCGRTLEFKELHKHRAVCEMRTVECFQYGCLF